MNAEKDNEQDVRDFFREMEEDHEIQKTLLSYNRGKLTIEKLAPAASGAAFPSEKPGGLSNTPVAVRMKSASTLQSSGTQ